MKQKPMEPDERRTPLFPVEEMTEPEALQMPSTSDTDMTGLIPAGPQNREELESYGEIYPYLPPYIDIDQM